MERTSSPSSQGNSPIWTTWENSLEIDDYQPEAGLSSDSEEDDDPIFSCSSSSSSSSSTYPTKYQFLTPSLACTAACSSPPSTIDDLVTSGRVQKIEHKRGILEGITRIFIATVAGLAYVLSLGCFTWLGNYAWEQLERGTNLLYPPLEYQVSTSTEEFPSKKQDGIIYFDHPGMQIESPDLSSAPSENAISLPPPQNPTTSIPCEVKSSTSNNAFQAYPKENPFVQEINPIQREKEANAIVLNHRIDTDPAAIKLKLAKQLACAQQQMNLEKDKRFCYDERTSLEHMPRNTLSENPANYPIKRDLGICSSIGRRLKMEDESLADAFSCTLANGTQHNIELFGIFDGHGGNLASSFVKTWITEELKTCLKEHNPQGLSDLGIWNALKMTFVHLHEKFTDPSSGTAATVAMIIDGDLWTPNAGDSRTVLNNGGEPIQLSEDAKPSDERYAKGIEKRGGFVLNLFGGFRVGGALSMARAIGDHDITGIDPRPKITVYPLSDIRPGSHLILACDGIWDVASTRQIVKAAHEHPETTALELAQNIITAAYAAGSGDNLSALVVKLA